MASLRFSWDNRKDKSNQKKHGISFEEAQTIFLRVLVVCHCFRASKSEIRIISARKATKKEQKVYLGG